MEYIIAMLDLFYANRHMYDRLQKQKRRKESNEKVTNKMPVYGDSMDYIIAMLDLFYANKHLHDRLQKQKRRKESNEK